MSHILLLFSAWATAHMGIKLAEAQVPSASLDLSHSVKKIMQVFASICRADFQSKPVISSALS